MSDFVVAIPRPELMREASSYREGRTSRRLTAVAHTYAKYLPETLGRRFSLSWPASDRSAAVLSWTADESQMVNVLHDFWSLATDSRAGSDLLTSMALRGSSLVHTSSVWGSYAAVFGERYSNRVWFWNTTPALEAIHFGSDAENFYVSNKSLLVALALSHGHPDVAINTEYTAEYLHFGYSVSGMTAFSGVQTLDVNQSLVIHNGKPRFREAPQQLSDLPQGHSQDEGGEALAEALVDSTRRSLSPLSGDRSLQLRLSGGKDSRMLAGLVRRSDTDVRAITYGVESDVEVQLSRQIAQMANFKHSVLVPELAEGSSLKARVNRVIFECGGVPPSEAHLAATAGAMPSEVGEAIMLGQWPLMKGGIAKVMRYPDGGIRRAVHKQGSKLLSAPQVATFTDLLDSWYDSIEASTELEKLYLFARQFRSGRYLHSHIAHYSRDARVVYPISDMQVTAVCDALTMAEKVSQRAMFLAMRRIWPEVMALPLHGSVWLFEAGGPADISGKDYSSRTAPIRAGDAAAFSSPGKPGVGSIPVRMPELAAAITNGDRWDFLKSMLDAGIAESIENASAGEPSPPKGVSPLEHEKLGWRLLVADSWLSGDWREGLRDPIYQSA